MNDADKVILLLYDPYRLPPLERGDRFFCLVRDVAVVGVDDARWGQLVTAVIAIRPGSGLPELDDVRAHCRAALAAYKAPRAVVVVDEVVRSNAGKLDYPWAREQAAGVADGEVRDAR